MYCSCLQMIQNAIGFRCPQQYARFGSDVMRNGYRLPPGDLAPGIIIDEALFEGLHIDVPDDAAAGLALMLMLGRFGEASMTVPDSKA